MSVFELLWKIISIGLVLTLLFTLARYVYHLART